MIHPIRGLHHVTATVDDAQDDVDFCTKAIGLRLVKKTVNFDNHHVYHFYYGDERGAPGTIWTTFPYKGRGVRRGSRGAGRISMTSFSVPEGSLPFWRRRLEAQGAAVEEGETRFGESAITMLDPSGLLFELVASDRDDRMPWTGAGVNPDSAVRGLHSVTLVVRSTAKTVDVMRQFLGFNIVNETAGRVRLAVGGDAPGRRVEIVEAPEAAAAINGLGTVHHVAFAIVDGDEQRRLQAELRRAGLQVTEVMDRQYFQSIYFREPGGVLFEAATLQPGFTLDEDVSDLGHSLKLPPWEEPNRAQIESGLAPLHA